MRRICGHSALAAVVLVGCLSNQSRAFAQAAPQVEADAFVGQPLGVGRMTVTYPADSRPVVPTDQNFWLTDKAGRVLYPAYSTSEVRGAQKIGERSLDSVTVFFLFRGDEPLDLSLDVLDTHRAAIKPVRDDRMHKMRQDAWWRLQSALAVDLARNDAYSPQVENYVTSMLARRLSITAPKTEHPWSGRLDVDQIFGTLMGAESVRLAMQKETLLKKSENAEKADIPLPAGVTMPAIEIPNIPGDVAIEPMVRHVPAECFYVRCGSFANFQWLRTTVDTWGGSLRDLVAVRGLDYDIRGHLERQLALQETVLSKLLGDAVISDVAIIGTDTFFREGAAVGIVFQAKSNPVLSAALTAMRADALKAEKGAAEKKVNVGGRKVSLLATPDNTVRSFYVADGDFHLITTSEYVVRRFLEAGQGKDPLGDLKEFRYSRSLMPLSRKDTLFVYLSDPWFRLLVSPQYRVEMTRRMQAEAEIELVQLAKLAAHAEKQPHATPADLITGGFLPRGFGVRPDGSKIAMNDDAVADSLRGARRAFLPVPDVAVEKITRSEQEAYEQFRRTYISQWQRVDPVIIGVKREEKQVAGAKREKVVLDVHITPYARQHYAFFEQFLGPADVLRTGKVTGNLLDAELKTRWSGSATELPEFRFFAGLRDFTPQFGIQGGRVVPGPFLEDPPPFYFGESPPSAGSFLGGGRIEVPEGYSERPDRGWLRWIRKFDRFVGYSNSKSVLESVTPQFQLEKAERPAQLRLRLADLSQSQAAPLMNAYGYERARTTSAGNAHFLHALMQQLRVDADKAAIAAETILAAKPVCPLRGKYELKENGPGPVRWVSTGWMFEYQSQENRIPANFRFAFLDWLRGLDLEFTIDRTTLTTHIELELQPPANP